MDNKQKTDWQGLVYLVIFGLVIWGGYNLLLTVFGEREGIVKYADCREIVTLQPDTLQKYFHKFTCDYRKTKSGKIMSGECVRIVNDSALFSSSHTCATAYVYEKKQEEQCPATNPYIGYDDMCYTTPQ